MKRSITITGASVVGFVGVVALHPPATTQTSLASHVSSASSATSGAQSSPSTTSGSGASAASSTTTTQPTTTTVAPTGIRTAVGKVENYGYGDLAVTVTANGTKITDIVVSTFQSLESYSQGLEQQVVPILKQEALKAQSARISALSGATYTCEAYAYSLQAALDKLGIK